MMRNRGWLVVPMAGAALLMAGCKGEPAPSATQAASITASETATATDASRPAGDLTQVPSGGGRHEKEENGLYQFAYSYPDAAGAIPGLKAALDTQLDDQRKDLIAAARDGRAEARKDDFPYHAHSYEEEWKVVTDIPGWLSLSSEFYEYAGGAHGMSGAHTLLWDRNAETVRKPLDLFTSAAALSRALRTPFCAALNKERGKRRGSPVDPDSDEMFNDCIDPVEQVVILGSSNGQTFNRIGLLVPPYNAGPYAEGSYEVTLPVTAAVMAALKPQFRSGFSVAK